MRATPHGIRHRPNRIRHLIRVSARPEPIDPRSARLRHQASYFHMGVPFRDHARCVCNGANDIGIGKRMMIAEPVVDRYATTALP